MLYMLYMLYMLRAPSHCLPHPHQFLLSSSSSSSAGQLQQEHRVGWGWGCSCREGIAILAGTGLGYTRAHGLSQRPRADRLPLVTDAEAPLRHAPCCHWAPSAPRAPTWTPAPLSYLFRSCRGGQVLGLWP